MKRLVALFLPFLLTACVLLPGKKPQSYSFFAMGTYIKITAYGGDKKTFTATEKEIRRLEKLFSAEDTESEVSRLSKNGKLISKETARLIALAKKWNKETDGAFDISLAPLSKLWGFPHGPYRIPSEQERLTALKNTGMDAISCNEKTGEIILQKKDLSLDLGGIAKGTGAEKAAEILKSQGVKSALLDLGGHIKAIGTKPDGSPWRIALRHPDDPDKSAGTLSISDTSIVTSGDYERWFMENGRRYHHILNPATGEPVRNTLRAVTVVCEDSEKADILSTALFVMGEEKAAAFWKNHRSEFQMIVYKNDNTLLVTPDLQKTFISELPVNFPSR